MVGLALIATLAPCLKVIWNMCSATEQKAGTAIVCVASICQTPENWSSALGCLYQVAAREFGLSLHQAIRVALGAWVAAYVLGISPADVEKTDHPEWLYIMTDHPEGL